MKISKSLFYSTPDISVKEKKSVLDVLNSGFLTTGPKVPEFENKLKTLFNSKYVISCSNGTSALLLASIAAGLKPGDTVLVPAITFVATANVPKILGAKIIFVDVDPDTGLICLKSLKKILKNKIKIKILYLVHLNGQNANSEEVSEILKPYNILIIEDACHAIGTKYFDKRKKLLTIGSCYHTDLATFSFHAVKNITTGEGGAVSCKSERMAKKIMSIRNHGFKPSFGKSNKLNLILNRDMIDIGFNFRLSDLQSAIGITQIERFGYFFKKKQKLYNAYKKLLKPIENFAKLVEIKDSEIVCIHLLVLLIDFRNLKITKKKLIEKLLQKNIFTQIHYKPVYKNSYFKSQKRLAGAESYYSSCLSIPFHTSMTLKDVKYVVDNLVNIIK